MIQMMNNKMTNKIMTNNTKLKIKKKIRDLMMISNLMKMMMKQKCTNGPILKIKLRKTKPGILPNNKKINKNNIH